MERILISLMLIVLFFILLYKWFSLYFDQKVKSIIILSFSAIYPILCVVTRFIINSRIGVQGIDTSIPSSFVEFIYDLIFILVVFKGNMFKKILFYLFTIILIPSIETTILGNINRLIGQPNNSNFYEQNSYINFFSILIISYLIILVIEEGIRKRKYNTKNYFFSIIFIIIIFQFMMYYYFSYFCKITTDEDQFTQYQLIYAFTVMIFFCICMMYEKSITVYEQTIDVNRQLEYFNYQLLLHDDSMKNLKEIKKIRHDFKNHLIALKKIIKDRDNEQASRYITELEDSISNTCNFVDAQNPVVSALLTYKKNVCQQNNIEFKYNLEYDDIQISPIDLSIILGNILDNAIEACMKFENPKDRIIKFGIGSCNNFITIICSNPYKVLVKNKTSNTNFLTTKPDKKNHGFGLTNVEETVNKYNGNLKIDKNNNMFTISLCIKKNLVL